MERMLFDWIKKKLGRKNAGKAVEANNNIRPIPFRTPYGGACPVHYTMPLGMEKIPRQLRKEVDLLIKKGMIDEYSDVNMFDELMKSYYTLCYNGVEKQAISHKHVIESIRSTQQSAMLKNQHYYNTAIEELEKEEDVEEESSYD